MKKLKAVNNMNPSLVIWVSWYKKKAMIPTDFTEEMIRYYTLNNNLTDIKICAVSDWRSGLKLVAPLKKR